MLWLLTAAYDHGAGLVFQGNCILQQLLPVVCINFAIVAGCMAYLSWLSWYLAMVLAGVIIFDVLSFSLFSQLPKKAVFKAWEEYDVLSCGFRALTEGVRELKLHRQRGLERLCRARKFTAGHHPPEGILASANDRRLGKNYPYVIGHQFGNGYRAYRITQQLTQMPKIEEQALFSLQLDTERVLCLLSAAGFE